MKDNRVNDAGATQGFRRHRDALLRLVRTQLMGPSDSATAKRVVAIAFTLRVMSAAIAFACQILMARWMGGNEYGVYIYVWVWVLILGQISNFGLASAAQKFIPLYNALQDFASVRGFVNGARWLGFGFATLVAGAGFGVLYKFGHLLNGPVFIPFYLALFLLPAFVLTDIQDGIARAYNWTLIGLVPPYIGRPLLHLLSMALVFAMGYPRSAAVAMACALGTTWLVAFAQTVALNLKLRKTLPSGPQDYHRVSWLKTALPIVLVEGFFMILTHCDVVVLEQFRSHEEVAIYWAAIKTLALVAFVYFAVSAAAAHRFAEYHATEAHERLKVFVHQTSRWTFFPSLLAVFVLLVIGKPMLWLFGPTYVAGYEEMCVLALGLLARSSIGPVERLLSMLGHQMRCALIYALAFACNLVLAILLVPQFGLMGAAVATMSAMVVETLLLALAARNMLGLRVFVWQRP